MNRLLFSCIKLRDVTNSTFVRSRIWYENPLYIIKSNDSINWKNNIHCFGHMILDHLKSQKHVNIKISLHYVGCDLKEAISQWFYWFLFYALLWIRWKKPRVDIFLCFEKKKKKGFDRKIIEGPITTISGFDQLFEIRH